MSACCAMDVIKQKHRIKDKKNLIFNGKRNRRYKLYLQAMKKATLAMLFVLSAILVLIQCNPTDTESPYLNIQQGGAEYVGMETCRQCHEQVYETYIQTGMGQSWGLANKAKSAADFSPGKTLVYDSIKDLYYHPYWDGDSLAIREFRLQDGDTVHVRTEKVSYIVGSGQHTNSHILNINGYLHQAPITFYTQKGKWDLAPGFEHGMNSRFERKIELECITCHNGYPNFDPGSLNKYTQVKLGIDCERCHGPGSLHVAEKKKGHIVDTSQGPDYTIVNPRRLSTEAQNNLCQRCHLQGITVLNDRKSFTDFLPSQELKHTMNTFMPSYSGSEQHMIMASHVERMKMSNCYLQSGKMSCISCHNPHVSVRFTPQTQYLQACTGCHHAGQSVCGETAEKRAVQQDNCITCHMPKNGSIDIPHVAVTDHFIRRRPALENRSEIIRFIGMQCYNNNNPDELTRARAFLEFYERYEPQAPFLDSAFYYLKQSGIRPDKDPHPDLIRVYFLRENYQKIAELASTTEPAKVQDAWTAYRIGESYYRLNNHPSAIAFLQRSVQLKPLALDFRNKLTMALMADKQWNKARETALFIQRENPRYAMAWFHLGYLALAENRLPLARQYLQQALLLNPDHVQTLINLAVVFHQTGQHQLISPLLQHALRLEPDNQQVRAMLTDLKS